MTAEMLAVIDQEADVEIRPQPLAPAATQEMQPETWAMIKEQAITLEIAGQGTGILPKGITNRAQIAAIIMKGRELGLAPMYSLEQIGLVNGKPVVQSQALTAIIQHAHGPDAIRKIDSTDEHAVIEFRRRGAEPMQLEWTVGMAKQAGLMDKSGPWKQYTRTMLRWRCIAEGARIYFADTIAGLYLPDEMGLDVAITSSGDMVIDDRSRKEPDAPPATGGPVNVEHETLLDQVMESLRRLSEKRQTTGKKLMTEWKNETGAKISDIGVMNNPQLKGLLAWSNAQLQPAPVPAPEETDADDSLSF